jgi:hypothetical protein
MKSKVKEAEYRLNARNYCAISKVNILLFVLNLPMNWRLTCSSVSGLELLEYVSFVTVPGNTKLRTNTYVKHNTKACIHLFRYLYHTIL